MALLHQLRGHLRGLDLSHLSIRGAYLQGIEMQNTTLSGARLCETVFTEAFAAPWVVAMSPNGDYRAAGKWHAALSALGAIERPSVSDI
jgi:hypothetical protein